MSMDLTFEDYDEVFTPAGPVTLPDFFVGREQEVADLKRGLKRKGEFPVVVGPRGVGKTSLVTLGLSEYPGKKFRLNCYEDMTFNELALGILREIGFDVNVTEEVNEVKKKVDGSAKIFEVGVATSGEHVETRKSAGVANRRIKPLELFHELLANVAGRATFVLDEYDRVDPNDRAFHSSVADFLKTLADNSDRHQIRFIIVGISESAAALLGKHRSIERSAKEVYVRTLRNEDILTFLNEAEEQLGFLFQELVKRSIVEFSMGFPYYVHLVGVESIDCMLSRLRKEGKAASVRAHRVIGEQDYVDALRRAVRRAFQSNLSKYRENMRGLSSEETEIIKTLCLVDDRSPISRQALWERLPYLTHRSREQFDSLLLNLQQERKVLHIGRTNNYVKFADPLLAPFLRSWYHREKMIPYSATSHPDQLPLFSETA
jgi:hypothetical protein